MNQRYDLKHNGVNLILYNFGKAYYYLPVDRSSIYYGKVVNVEGFVNQRGILSDYVSPYDPLYTVIKNVDLPFRFV